MKILVVEDDLNVVQALRYLLLAYHYAVDIAEDGETGLVMAEDFDYDLILLDVFLPSLDGVSLCQQLRSKGVKTPILLLTGQEDEHQKAIALNLGADDYVVKPFNTEELIARIQALLRRGGPKLQPVLSWGNLTVDPSSLDVRYGDRQLSMRPKEYAILELLLRNQQKTFNAKTLIDQVWSSLESPGEEAVRGHIKELRKKIKTAGAPDDFIETVHGMGYRLNPFYASPSSSSAHEPSPQTAGLTSASDTPHKILDELSSRNQELHRHNEDLADYCHTLQQETQFYRRLFELVSVACLVTTLDGIIQRANLAATSLLKQESRSLVGTALAHFVEPSNRASFHDRLTNSNWTDPWQLVLQVNQTPPFSVMVSITQISSLPEQNPGLFWQLHCL